MGIEVPAESRLGDRAISSSDVPADIAPTLVRLSGSINETVGFGFSVQVGERPIEQALCAVAADEEGASGFSGVSFSLFRLHRVHLDRYPGWHVRSILPGDRNSDPLDVVVPIDAPTGGLPETLQANTTYHLWADVLIAKGTSDGSYTSRIQLLSGSKLVGEIDVVLTAWPIVLPDQGGVAAIAELDRAAFESSGRFDSPDDPAANRKLVETLRLLRRHRVTPVFPKLRPSVRLNALQQPVIDWQDYDAVAGLCLDGEAFDDQLPVQHWILPVSGVLQSLSIDSGRTSVGPAHLLGQCLTQIAQHFDEKGWLDRSVALVPNALPFSEDTAEAICRFSALAHQADERIKVGSRFWPQDMAPYGWVDFPLTKLGEAIDVWIPPAQFFDPKVMAAERESHRSTWVAVDRPPYFGSLAIHAPPAYARVLPWQVKELGSEVLYLGSIASWPAGAEKPSVDECITFDPSVLLYPGEPFGLDHPVASMRLKRLRRGLFDAAYRHALERNGLDYVSATLGQSLAARAGTDAYRSHFSDGRAIGWVEDTKLFDTARTIMAEALVRQEYGTQRNDPRADFAKNATWRRFMLETRGVHFRTDGVRTHLVRPGLGATTRIECFFTLTNDKRIGVSGVLRVSGLPEGWLVETDGDEQKVTVGPNQIRRVHLAIVAASVPVQASPFRVEFVTDEGEAYQTEVRVSCASALPLGGGIRVDGDLSDWPVGAVHVASGFKLICGKGDGIIGDALSPSLSTLAFFLRDDKNLYVAINAAIDPDSPGPAERSNRVVYDDLIPRGEDLVELLLDPFNAGTRSPSDLYRIAVKRSGSYDARKGLAFDPPCGVSQRWAVDVEVASQIKGDRWLVELRIPLEAFEDAPTKGAIWGANVTRLDAGRQEFSTWSGASGNAYDPLSLGNLYFP